MRLSEIIDQAIDFIRPCAVGKQITFEIAVSDWIAEEQYCWTISRDMLKGLLTGVLERVPDGDTISILFDQVGDISIVFIQATRHDAAIPLRGPKELIVMLDKRGALNLGRH
jgi:hypothetical protein